MTGLKKRETVDPPKGGEIDLFLAKTTIATEINGIRWGQILGPRYLPSFISSKLKMGVTVGSRCTRAKPGGGREGHRHQESTLEDLLPNTHAHYMWCALFFLPFADPISERKKKNLECDENFIQRRSFPYMRHKIWGSWFRLRLVVWDITSLNFKYQINNDVLKPYRILFQMHTSLHQKYYYILLNKKL